MYQFVSESLIATEGLLAHPAEPKLPYSAPRLSRYGKVTDLTQSGSGTSSENASSGCGLVTRKPNTNC